MSDAIPRTDSLQAMQSLLGGAYDDDTFIEGQDLSGELETSDKVQEHDINNISGSEDEEENHRNISPIVAQKEATPGEDDAPEEKRPKLERKPTRLVSYGPDDVDEDRTDSDSEDSSQGEGEPVQIIGDEPISDTQLQSQLSRSMLNKSGDEIKLPPEPPGKCARHIEAKVIEMQERAKKRHSNVNEAIQRRKDFRNPSIYEKLIEFCHIDEKGTNYPPEIYDPSIYGKESFYDSLAKIQKEEMDRREREKKERTKVEFVTATKKGSSDMSKAGSQGKLSSSGGSSTNLKQDARKSKWDTQGQANTNTSAKTTVISASGTLKKQKS